MATKSFLTGSSVETAEFSTKLRKLREEIERGLGNLDEQQRGLRADSWRRGYAAGFEDGGKAAANAWREALGQWIKDGWVMMLACFVIGAGGAAIVFGVLQLI